MKKMNFLASLHNKNDSVILSYQTLRRLIGILGILLPFINILGGYLITQTPVQQSISLYYYTNMRDFFVGIIFLIALFLVTYKGYDKLDCYITTVTGIAGLGIAIFPCSNELYQTMKLGMFQITPSISEIFHQTFTATFLILLAIISLFFFTKSDDPQNITPQKKVRNIIYIGCGVIILLSLLVVLIGILVMTKAKFMAIGWLIIYETIALLAFGVSWLVKGETIIKDREVTNAKVLLNKAEVAVN